VASPGAAMAILTETAGSNIGQAVYVQLDFTASLTGNFFVTAPGGYDFGSFTMN